ncbi:MAG: transposase family protein [Spirulina sp. SIO3F2]|nr:transposase family protein [Spirulina sp. SIO3F2]
MWLLLVLILLGTLCGYRGYRPLADFCQNHWLTLCQQLELRPETRIPSYSTFRRVLHRVDFEPLLSLFNEWGTQFLPLSETTWVAGDGKAIKSTMSDYSESYHTKSA